LQLLGDGYGTNSSLISGLLGEEIFPVEGGESSMAEIERVDAEFS